MGKAIHFDVVIIIAMLISGCASPPKAQNHTHIIETEAISETQDVIETPVEEPIDYVIELYQTHQLPPTGPQIDKPRKKLVYGEPKPLVCSYPFPAENALAKRPNIQVMWEHYLYEGPRGVWAEVGGAVEYNGCLPEDLGGWRNACTVRMSHMLNQAGHKIPFLKGQTVSGENGDQYFFRLEDMQAYLIDTLGKPDVDTNDSARRWHKIPYEPGLLIMRYPGSNFTGHSTIWNGAGTVDGTDIAGLRILFWRLPCFIPVGRQSGS